MNRPRLIPLVRPVRTASSCLDLAFLARGKRDALCQPLKMEADSPQAVQQDRGLDDSDVTRELCEQWEYFWRLFENSSQGLIMIDQEGAIVCTNPNYERMFSNVYDESLIPDSLYAPSPCRCRDETALLVQTVLDGEIVETETYRLQDDNSLVRVSVVALPVWLGQDILGAIFIYSDIRESMPFETRQDQQVSQDCLTGLPGRRIFLDRLEMALKRNQRCKEYSFAVFLIDLDRFMWINNTYGHPVGDRVLVTVANRLAQGLTKLDTVARFGDDEFAVLLDDLSGHRDILAERRRIHEFLTTPCSMPGGEVKISVSMGVVLSVRNYVHSQDILRDVNTALFRSKKQGNGRFKVFTDRMRGQSGDVLRLETELREAVEREEFIFYYQPILDVETLHLTGFEALIRWRHPSGVLISPDSFIPTAEDTGLIHSIGRWSITQACRQLRTWMQAYPGAPGVSMNVNLSPRQFYESGLIKFIAQAIADEGIPPESLRIEISESMLMQNASSSADRLRRLKRLGVQIGIDDFGTGYSSLAYLRDLPIDFLKVDSSFISGKSGRVNFKIVRFILDLARKLRIKVVAEGVEDMMQLTRLRALRCDKAQGFFFARPETPETAEKWIDGSFPATHSKSHQALSSQPMDTRSWV